MEGRKSLYSEVTTRDSLISYVNSQAVSAYESYAIQLRSLRELRWLRSIAQTGLQSEKNIVVVRKPLSYFVLPINDKTRENGLRDKVVSFFYFDTKKRKLRTLLFVSEDIPADLRPYYALRESIETLKTVQCVSFPVYKAEERVLHLISSNPELKKKYLELRIKELQQKLRFFEEKGNDFFMMRGDLESALAILENGEKITA